MPQEYKRLHLDRDNNKLIRLFKDSGLELSKKDDHEFIKFAREKIETYLKQERLIPDDIAVEIVSDYVGMDKEAVAKLYFNDKNSASKKRVRLSLVNMVGRDAPHKFVLICDDPQLEKTIIEQALKYNIILRSKNQINDHPSYSTPDNRDKQRILGPHGTGYKRTPTFEMHNAKLLIEQSPKKEDLEFNLTFDKDFSEKFFSNKNKERAFHFTVTQSDQKQRVGVKRKRQQKSAMDGYSAAEIFKALGVIDNKTVKFHLAHRQGHSLNGMQHKDNLDPATAGSNYTTLFYVESFIHSLLNQGVDEVNVTGEIEYHPIHKGLPQKITYKCEWGEGKSFIKSIFPLSSRVPSVQEYLTIRAIASIAADSESSPSPERHRPPSPVRRRLPFSFFSPEEKKEEEQADKGTEPSPSNN